MSGYEIVFYEGGKISANKNLVIVGIFIDSRLAKDVTYFITYFAHMSKSFSKPEPKLMP